MLLKAVEVNPRLTAAWINLGVSSYDQTNLAASERRLRRGLETDPQLSYTYGWLNNVLRGTGRHDEALIIGTRGLEVAANAFDRRHAYIAIAAAHLDRQDLPSARKCLLELKEIPGAAAMAQALDAVLATRDGRPEQAGGALAVAETSLELNPTVLSWAIEACLARGELDRALAFANRPIFLDLHTTILRLTPALQPLLDQPQFGPRVSQRTLVWPAEAPPVPKEIAALFTDVRIESGLPTSTGT